VSATTEISRAALGRVAGLQLDSYRLDHVAERVRRALEREGLDSVDALERLLRTDAEARRRFRRSVAISVTGPFRDRHQFELLEHRLLPPLLADGRTITVWSAGCAHGSELHSVAMLLQRLGALDRTVLLGSDVLEENVASARSGEYGLALARLPGVRVRWERRDLVRDGAPAGRWRLVVCRNVAIYLSAEAKAHLHRTLAGVLARDGVLLLGRSERLLDARMLGVTPVGPNAYRRTG
jgi:chemotaxis protein methyltransferase CheR